MLRDWLDAISSSDFWSDSRDFEESGDFEPAAAREEFDELKADSFKLVVEPVAELARDAASRSDFELCGRALQIIRGVQLPPELVTGLEEDVLGPYEDGFNRLSKEISKRCWNEMKCDWHPTDENKKPCSTALERWKQELWPKYDEFVAMAGSGSVPYHRVTESYADFLASMGNASSWADWWAKAEDLLIQARDLVGTDSPARERIETRLRSVAAPAARQRLALPEQIEQRSQLKPSIENVRGESLAGEKKDPPPESTQTSEKDAALQAARNLAGFCDLCSSLQSKCWEPFAVRSASPQTQRLSVLCVRREYEAKVSPWLNVILAAYQGNTDVLQPVQNAAASCLSSLARAFFLVNDLENARRLAAEALALVLEQEQLEREIKDCLQRITSKRNRSTTRQPPASKADAPTDSSSKASSEANSWSASSIIFALAAAPFAVAILLACVVALSGRDPEQKPSTQQISVEAATPADRNRESIPLLNGTNLADPIDTSGSGILCIKNYLGEDAFVKLRSLAFGQLTVRFVYVKALNEVTLTGIPHGAYVLQISKGNWWDRIKGYFRRDPCFVQLKDQLSFAEGHVDSNAKTLALPLDANRTRNITAEEFEKGAPRE